MGLFCVYKRPLSVPIPAYQDRNSQKSARYSIVLQRVAVCCSRLQRVAACFSVSQCVIVLQRVKVCYSVLKCVTACCSVLQCVAV